MEGAIFTLVYSKDFQMRFERAIKEKRLDEAQQEIEKIPPAKSTLEELYRLIVLTEAYKALAESRKEMLFQALTDYRSLGTINQISVEKELLSQYRSLGNLESLKAKLAKISEFEESARKLTRKL